MARSVGTAGEEGILLRMEQIGEPVQKFCLCHKKKLPVSTSSSGHSIMTKIISRPGKQTMNCPPKPIAVMAVTDTAAPTSTGQSAVEHIIERQSLYDAQKAVYESQPTFQRYEKSTKSGKQTHCRRILMCLPAALIPSSQQTLNPMPHRLICYSPQVPLVPYQFQLPRLSIKPTSA